MLAPPPVHSVAIVAAWFTDIICMAQFTSLMHSAANAEGLAAPISHTNLIYLKNVILPSKMLGNSAKEGGK